MKTPEMHKTCCVGDADICPKSSSCSMVLRSACSHRHSRESSTVREKVRAETPRKRMPFAPVRGQSVSYWCEWHPVKLNGSRFGRRHTLLSKTDSHNGTTLHLGSVLESSLKTLAVNSSQDTYSLLKERLYSSYEVSENVNQQVFQANVVNVACARELLYSHLSSSNNLSINGNLSQRECSSDYSSASESNINSSGSVDSTSNMSRTHFTRSSAGSMRSLSGSEEDISIEKIIRARKVKSDLNANYGMSRKAVHSESELNSHLLTNSHSTHSGRFSGINSQLNNYAGSSGGDSQAHSTESSHLDRSTVQYSAFDRFRWFIWRCIYLKIIKNVNFDVWYLSRLHNFGKSKAILLFILPLLLYITWDLISHSTFPYEALSTLFSPVLMFFSSVFSSFRSLLVQTEELVTATDLTDATCDADTSKILSFFTSLSGGFGLFSGWFTKNSESTTTQSETEYMSEHSTYPPYSEKIRTFLSEKEEMGAVSPSKEEIRLVALEVLKDEIDLLKELHRSQAQGTQREKAEKELRLQNEIKNLRLEFKSLSGSVQNLEKDTVLQTEKDKKPEYLIALTSDYKAHIDDLHMKMRTIEAKLGVLEGLKSCCDKQFSEDDLLTLMEKNLFMAFKNIVDGDSDPNSRYNFFHHWLNSKFFSHEKLMAEINTALRKQSAYQKTEMDHDYVVRIIESTVHKYVESIKKNITGSSGSSFFGFGQDVFSEDKIKKIVKEAIMLYDADKTGQVDYALESGGGSVLGTRCSETYVEKYGKLAMFGIPLWTNSNSPRTAIQPDVQPGRCWAFKGSQGFLVLELSATIYPTGFTLEHIPVSLSPTGSIDSAPKNFSVWGLESEKDSKGNLLGEYWYDINGDPLQYFEVQKPSRQPYSYVELQIHSNNGNMEYTCLYRFRVHGTRV